MSAIVTIVGNLGQDPEVRTTTGGKKVTSLSVGVKAGKDANGSPRTNWYRVSCWGQDADYAENYGAKGRQVVITGRLEAKIGQGRDGQSYLNLDLTANSITWVGAVQDKATGPAGSTADADPYGDL